MKPFQLVLDRFWYSAFFRNFFSLENFLYKLSFTFIDLAMPVVIHGLELYMFGFLLKDINGAYLSNTV